MDKIISQSNDAYSLGSKVEDENVYEPVPPRGGTLPQEEVNSAAVKERKLRVNCYAIVTIIALVMSVLSLIVALVAVSYATIELNNQQGQLGSSSLEMESQINQIRLSNEQCKIQISDLHTHLNNSNQMLNDSNQQIQILFQDVREIIATVSVRSCSDIPQYKPSGEYWIATDSTSSPV